MRTYLLLLIAAMLLTPGCGQGSSGQVEGLPAPPPGQPNQQPAPPNLQGKHVLMIIAHQNFRDEELLKPRQILQNAGAEITIASSSLAPARGALGATVKPDLLLKDVNPADYAAVVFVGGPGAKEYWQDQQAHEIARLALDKDKPARPGILAAICIAPVTLANAGVLKGKRATVWPSEAPRLKAAGAIYTAQHVETDGPIITADGPESAAQFGQALLKALADSRSPEVQSAK